MKEETLNKKGFSLIEVLIVLVVAGVILAMVMSLSRSWSIRSEFKGAVNQLIADINFAKQFAARENRYVAVRFDDNGKFYTIEKQQQINDFGNWTVVRPAMQGSTPASIESMPLDGQRFFYESEVTDFAINSRGEVYEFSDLGTANQIAKTIQLRVIKESLDGTQVYYERNIQILPYGGIKVEE